MKIKGLHTYRFKDHPLEELFAKEWEKENAQGHVLEYLLSQDNRRGSVSKQDILVAAPVIQWLVQWLGSPVGSSFVLRTLYHDDRDHHGERSKKP